MSTPDTTDDTLVRQIPIGDLLAPTHDVRDGRSDQDVSRLARSLERSGQIHALYVVPARESASGVEGTWSELSLDERATAATSYRIVDGMTRWLAARELHWSTIRCEVHREEPEDQPLVSLAANEDRVDMTEFETVTAIHDHYRRSGMTQEEIAQRVGMSRSRLSNLFRALDGYDPTVEAWQNPDVPVRTGHVLQVERLETDAYKGMAHRDLLTNERSLGMFEEVVDQLLQRERDEMESVSEQVAEEGEEPDADEVKSHVDGSGSGTSGLPLMDRQVPLSGTMGLR